MNKAFDGADWASCRFTSSIGTFKDMGLRPVNAEKSILRGEMPLSKFCYSYKTRTYSCIVKKVDEVDFRFKL